MTTTTFPFNPRYVRDTIPHPLTADEIKEQMGFDPGIVHLSALNELGVYPVHAVVWLGPKFNTNLYYIDRTFSTVYISQTFTDPPYGEPYFTAEGDDTDFVPGPYPAWWGEVGYYHYEVFTPRAKELVHAKRYSKQIVASLFRTFSKRVEDSFDANTLLFRGQTRDAKFDFKMAMVQRLSNYYNGLFSQIDSAVTVDDINNLVSPAQGVIRLVKDGNDLLAGDIEELDSITYTDADMELYCPGTNVTVSISNGVFPATANLQGTYEDVIQIRVASTGVVVDEILWGSVVQVATADYTGSLDDYPCGQDFGTQEHYYYPETIFRATEKDEKLGQYEDKEFTALALSSFSVDTGLQGTPTVADIVVAADDTAAAAAGVPINGVYSSNGTLKIRVS